MINNEISKGKFAILIGSLLELEESGRCGCICGDGGSDRNVQPSDFICEALGVEMCSIIKTLADHVYGGSNKRDFLSIRSGEHDSTCIRISKIVDTMEKMVEKGWIKII